MNTLHIEDLAQTVDALIVGDTRWLHRDNGMLTSRTMIYWNENFDPMTPNFHSTLISALVQRIEGFEVISEEENQTTFSTYDGFEISMTYDSSYPCVDSHFTFVLVGYPNDTPIANDEHNTGLLWSSDEDYESDTA